jgi:hypothetical protein
MLKNALIAAYCRHWIPGGVVRVGFRLFRLEAL